MTTLTSTFNSLYEIPQNQPAGFIEIELTFQFSLWDSYLIISIYTRQRWSFNSLYEILLFLRGRSIPIYLTFNSLYEIRDRETTDQQPVMDFQFSLWDSEKVEMPKIAGVSTLSILFMRFTYYDFIFIDVDL